MQRSRDTLDAGLLDGLPSRVVLGRRPLALVSHCCRQQDAAHTHLTRQWQLQRAHGGFGLGSGDVEQRSMPV